LAEVESRIQERAAGATKHSEVNFKGRIIEYIWMLKKQGYPGTTVRKYGWLIRKLRNCGVDLLDPEDVKRVVASHDNWSNSYKVQFVSAYDHWAKMLGLTWDKPHYKQEEKLPLIPTEHDIDQLIAGCGRKVATFLQLLKETGIRYREAWLLKWANIDFVRETVNVVSVKKGKPRQLKISRKLIGMLNLLLKKSEKVFGDISYGTMGTNLLRQRKRIATKLQNPRILQITPHKLRHWKASMEYHRTNNLLYVKEILGHRSILSTMIYTHLIEEPQNDEYMSRVTRSVEGSRRLVESGFEYIKEWSDGLMLFRKRK
jgi:integrase